MCVILPRSCPQHNGYPSFTSHRYPNTRQHSCKRDFLIDSSFGFLWAKVWLPINPISSASAWRDVIKPYLMCCWHLSSHPCSTTLWNLYMNTSPLFHFSFFELSKTTSVLSQASHLVSICQFPATVHDRETEAMAFCKYHGLIGALLCTGGEVYVHGGVWKWKRQNDCWTEEDFLD